MVKERVLLRLVSIDEADEKKQFVRANNYDILVDGEIVGRCILRFGHNQNTFWGGNIGYFINPAFRGHHYAREACLLLFKTAYDEGMDYLIITCNPDNIPSKKTCESLPYMSYLGVFELPKNNMMREKGETKKCIFKYSIGRKQDERNI